MKRTRWTRAAHRELRRTAYHEAGHAVAANTLERYDGPVTIVPNPDEGTLGCARPEEKDLEVWFTSEQSEKVRREEAIVAYAGHAAEVALLRRGDMTDESAIATGAGPDYAQASAWLSILPPSARDEARQQALDLVRSERRAIIRLAKGLLRNRSLGADEVDALIAGGAMAAALYPEAFGRKVSKTAKPRPRTGRSRRREPPHAPRRKPRTK